MTIEGGQAGRWADGASGVRNSRAVPADQADVLPHLDEKFELTGRHAEGATCEVFKAHHVALDIAVAVKVLRPEYVADARFLERMRIEAQVLPRLRSPHIVQCFDRGLTADGRPFTVLEFLRGETLEALLERFGRLDELVTIELGTALLDALSVAHARGIVHRDVSLRNLMVHRTEHDSPTLKLIDFGFAIVMPGAPESAPEPAQASERDAAVGTPRFTSPEVATGRSDVDGRADLYSTGAILYTLLAGRDPFAALRTPEAVLEAHAHRSVPPLSLYAHGVSKELESVVMRLLEKERAQRFASAEQARQALTDAAKTIRATAVRRSTAPKAQPLLRADEQCGPYVVRRLVDAEGLFEVYEVETTGIPRKQPLALKIAKRELAMGSDLRASILEAARSLTAIRHPCLATVHRTGEHAGRPWISLDWVEGTPLGRHLDRDRPLSLVQAVKIAMGVANGLRQLERAGTAHGNLTPRTVMVTAAGEARLIPCAPARAQGASSDVYAWGLVLLEMLADRRASQAASPREGTADLRSLLPGPSGSLPGLREGLDHVPKRLRQLVEAATDARPSLRPGNFTEVCAALDEACTEIALVKPLVLTARCAVAANGRVLVQLWRGPTPEDVREVHHAVRSVAPTATLIVVENGSPTPDIATRRELARLANALEPRPSVAAIVYEGRAISTPNHSTDFDTTLPQDVPRGTFTTTDTAVDWLSRYHPDLAGLSDLTGVVAHLRRRQPPVSNVDARGSARSEGATNSPLSSTPSTPPPLEAPMIRLRDRDQSIVTWDRALIQIWHGRVTSEAITSMEEITRAFCLECSPPRIIHLMVVEASSPAPSDGLRRQFAGFFSSFTPQLAKHIIVAEGGAFRESLVRSVGVDLSTLAKSAIPFHFASTVPEAARIVAPHLSSNAGGVEGLLRMIRQLRETLKPDQVPGVA